VDSHADPDAAAWDEAWDAQSDTSEPRTSQVQKKIRGLEIFF
jgi:hypothetical protein